MARGWKADVDASYCAAQAGMMWKQIIFAVAAVVISGCSGGCENSLLSEVGSPNGRLSAVLFARSCGATTADSTQISVVRAGVVPAASGNAFVADANHGAADGSAGGGPWVEAVWVDDDNLIVKYDAQARVFTEQPHIAGVKVTYQPIER